MRSRSARPSRAAARYKATMIGSPRTARAGLALVLVCAAVVLAACALFALPAGAVAATGVLSGRVSNLPAARGLSFADAYAIDPDSGDVARTGEISHAAFRLSLPPGPYLAAVAAQ